MRIALVFSRLARGIVVAQTIPDGPDGADESMQVETHVVRAEVADREFADLQATLDVAHDAIKMAIDANTSSNEVLQADLERGAIVALASVAPDDAIPKIIELMLAWPDSVEVRGDYNVPRPRYDRAQVSAGGALQLSPRVTIREREARADMERDMFRRVHPGPGCRY